MAFLRQTWTLTRKNLLIVAWRQFLATALRAVILPIAFAIFLGYVRTFLAPPSTYGIGSPRPIRNITEEFADNAVGNRRRVVFINAGGITGGKVDQVINAVATPLQAAGADVRFTTNTTDLFELCRSSLRGTSGCYGAATFFSAPGDGAGRQWSYQLTADYALGYQVFVERDDNDAQLFALPLSHAIDSEIASIQGNPFPSTIYEYPYTRRSKQERADNIQQIFMGSVGSWLGVTFFLAMCGISYHLPGFIATERELGMSQLIDSMVPGKHQLKSQLARFVSNQVAFAIIYIPSWISIGAIASTLVFLRTSHAIVILFHLLTGLSLACYSALGASFFRKSQLSGISVLISALVLAIVAQLAPISSKSAVIALSVLFPSANYTFFLQFMARYERRLLPANLDQTSRFSRYYDPNLFGIPGYYYWVFVVIQIFYYPILATLVERWRFGTSSKGRRIDIKSSNQQAAINIQGFSKQYFTGFWQTVLPSSMTSSWKAPVRAVKDLSLTVLQGETMVLLGANGSGKSTTLDTIAGIISPSKGLIEIDGSGGIGLCPQKNVMWPYLTVAEHVKIFDQLKANPKPGGQLAVEALIRGCDLELKADKLSKTLSGGQKRKLQLAMAFAGGSRVCCIDEVSSGLDPLSRRTIWDILIQERGRRTLLFTTHALDEADALADHVAIMSKGHLKVQGSVVELKNRYGGGYRVHVPGHVNPELVHGVEASVISHDTETVFQVGSSDDAARLVEALERQNIRDHNVSGPTIEDVFLQLAEEGREELSHVHKGHATYSAKPGASSTLSSDSDLTQRQQALKLHKGQDINVFQQTWILFRKRFRILSRNYMPYFCAVVIPLITAGLVTFFLANFSPLRCQFALNSNTPTVIPFPTFRNLVVGPAATFRTQDLPEIVLQSRYRLQLESTYSNFEDYIARNYANISLGGFFLDSPPDGNPTLTYRIDGTVIYAAFAQNIMDSYLAGTTINLQLSTFALPYSSSTGNSLQLIIYLGLAMSVFPAFFALYPTYERLRNIRTLHYSNGIQAAPLWLAYILFDLIWIVIVTVVAIILLTQLSSVWYAPGYLWVVLFLFGISSTLMSYVISLFATSQLAAFAFSAGSQAVLLLAYFIAFIGLVSFSLPDTLIRNLNIVQFTLGLITPSGNLLRALLLTLNQSQILCRDQTYVSYPGDIQIYGGPILYLVLQIFAFFAFLVAYDNGWRPRLALFTKKRTIATDHETNVGLAEKEVLDEAARTEKSQDALQVLHLNKSFGSELAVDDLTFGVKHGEVFALLGPNGAGKSTTISLIRGDIRPTNMKDSDILVEGISVNEKRTATRRNLGVCPQFDAIDRMTVTEHLRFYGRACGVRDLRNNVEKVIHAVGLQDFRNRMADQLSGGNKRKLSLGISIIGNPSVLLLDEPSSGMDAISKRIMWKLLNSVKAGRSLVLTTHSMEEVSALADRAGIMAKRMLAVGTTQMLRTNHGTGFYVHLVHKDAPSVSEAEQQRIAQWIRTNIPGAVVVDSAMLHGQLKFHIPLNTRSANETAIGSSTSPERLLNSSAHPHPDTSNDNSQTTSSSPIVHVLRLLEQNKDDLGITFYSVSPTTLEDVFLDIVGKHGVVEHDESKAAKGVGSRKVTKFLPCLPFASR